MIPNLINKIKVTFNIVSSKQQQQQNQIVKQKQQKQKQSTNHNNQQNQQSPPSPTFKNVQQQFKKLQINDSNKPSIQTVGKHGQSQHQFIKQMQNKQPNTQIRSITIKQLSQHKTKQSAWLSLDGIVYDVTIYLKHHPGGIILLQGCGKQCRQLFDQYHSWVNAKNLLAKYKIGWLVQ